jgi:hypothetical protein
VVVSEGGCREQLSRAVRGCERGRTKWRFAPSGGTEPCVCAAQGLRRRTARSITISERCYGKHFHKAFNSLNLCSRRGLTAAKKNPVGLLGRASEEGRSRSRRGLDSEERHPSMLAARVSVAHGNTSGIAYGRQREHEKRSRPHALVNVSSHEPCLPWSSRDSHHLGSRDGLSSTVSSHSGTLEPTSSEGTVVAVSQDQSVTDQMARRMNGYRSIHDW